MKLLTNRWAAQVYGLPWGMTLKYEAIVGPIRERCKAFLAGMKCWGKRSQAERV